MDNPFFDEAREQSLVKSAIVEKYFGAWTLERLRVPDHIPGAGGYAIIPP